MNENTTEKNTNLILFVTDAWWGPFNAKGMLANFMEIYNAGNYKFPITEMPVVDFKTEEYEEKYTTWRGKPGVKKVKRGVYYLSFKRVLTEDELNMWRMFKTGFLCRHCRPVGGPDREI